MVPYLIPGRLVGILKIRIAEVGVSCVFNW